MKGKFLDKINRIMGDWNFDGMNGMNGIFFEGEEPNF